MADIYDLIIVGAGPAGITAAIYAARKKLKTLVVSKDIGGQTALSGAVENYTGYQYITGFELARKFEEHVKEFDLDFHEREEVTRIQKVDDTFRVSTDQGAYEGKAVIIASGAKPKELRIPGEKEFKNRGVTYCATCDAPLFAGRDVAVIGGGNSAMDATLQLLSIARKIYLITINSELEGDRIMKEKVLQAKNVEVWTNTKTVEILGDSMVTAMRVVRRDEARLNVQGVFIEIGYTPNCEFIDIVEKNKLNEIKVDARCETNVLGIFAAGDVTDVPEKQIIIAAGEGSKAALSAFSYLSKKNNCGTNTFTWLSSLNSQRQA